MIKKEKLIVGTKQEIQDYLDNKLMLKPYVEDKIPGVNYYLTTTQLLNTGFQYFFYFKYNIGKITAYSYEICKIPLFIKQEQTINTKNQEIM